MSIKTVANKGDYLSRFHVSATATLFPAISAIITALSKCEELYTKMMNEANKLTVASANTSASAAKDSLEHQAKSMKWEAIMGFTSAGLSAVSVAVNLGVDGYYAKKTAPMEKEMKNGQTYLDAYNERLKTGPNTTKISDAKEIEMQDFGSEDTTEVEKILNSHRTTPEKTFAKPIEERPEETNAINRAKENSEVEESRKAIKGAIDQKKEEIREIMQGKLRRLDYARLVDTMIQQAPNAISKEIAQAQTKKQGAKESEKIIAGSSQSLSEEFEKHNSSQFSQTAQQMDQVIGQLEKMNEADRAQ